MNTADILAKVTGAILAGGKSTRMGRSKALLAFKDKAFLETVVGVLGTVLPHVVVIADNMGLADIAGVPVYPDIYKNSGPMGGIHTALVQAETECVFICPTDNPLMTCSEVTALLRAAKPGKVTIAFDGTRWHPLFGLYPASIRPELEASIKQGRLRLRDFIMECSAGYDLFEMRSSTPALRNINTAHDYDGLLKS